MLVTTLDGKIAAAARFTVFDREGTPFPLLLTGPTSLLPQEEPEEASDLGADLRGNLLSNCFHIEAQIGQTLRSSSCSCSASEADTNLIRRLLMRAKISLGHEV